MSAFATQGGHDKAIVDYTSATLCTPVPSPPFRRYAIPPIVNMPEEHPATDMGNTQKKFGKDRACGSGDILVDR